MDDLTKRFGFGPFFWDYLLQQEADQAGLTAAGNPGYHIESSQQESGRYVLQVVPVGIIDLEISTVFFVNPDFRSPGIF